jgi:hypothetical protein
MRGFSTETYKLSFIRGNNLKQDKMDRNKLRTEYSIKKEKRDLAIYEEYNRLVKDPKVSKTKVEDYLCEKYGLSSRSSIWFIRKRVSERMAAQEA